MGQFLPKGWTSSGVNPNKLSDYARRPDRWDLEDWRLIVQDIDAVAAARDRIGEVAPTGKEALADAYWTFMKVEPELAGRDEVKPSNLVNLYVAEEMEKLKETQRLRRHTVGDTVGSALAAESIEPDLETLFDRVDKQVQQAQALMSAMQALHEQEQESHDLEEVIRKWTEEQENCEACEANSEENGGDGQPCDAHGKEAQNYQEQWEKMQQALEAARQAAEQAGDEFEKGMQDALPGIRESLRDSIDRAADEAERMQQQSDSWGLEPGQIQRMPAQERLELARRLNNDRFKRIADLFGAMRNLMLTEVTRKTIAANEEVFDVELGEDLDRILPEQLVELRNPDSKLEFYRKLVEGELLQYQLRGQEKKAQGGILFCTDEATEIMTTDGWKRYTDLTMGEMVLTLNHETGVSEWQPLLRVNVFPAEKRAVLRTEGRRLSSLTTMDHRWAVVNGRQARTRGWRTSATLTTEDRIPVAAPCVSLPTEPKYEDALVELIAWTWTEGTILPPGNSLRIYQSQTVNPANCTAIRAALTACFGSAFAGDQRSIRASSVPAWREDVNPATGVVSFHLNRAASEPILAQMDNDKAVRPSFVQSLTTSQLRLFVEKSIDADGQRRRGEQNCDILGQRSEKRLRSFEMACVLLGLPIRTAVSPDARPERDGAVQHVTTIRHDGKTEVYLPERKIGEYDGVVWCPTTPNGTWLARRNGTVYFTGNCEDGSGSMHGERELWAKAVMLCLLHLARMQKRPFHLIHFGSPGQYKMIHFVEPEDWNIDRVLDAAELFFGGGTDFHTPLTKALELLQDEYRAKGAVEGDIVFCTDGMCGVSPDFMESFKEEQERLDFVVWGVNIGGSKADEPLNSICDGRIATVKDLVTGSDVRSVFAGV